MGRILFWSDLHLGHKKIYDAPFPKSYGREGTMRPFSSVEEADEFMIEQYNSTVQTDDKVYFVGDVVMDKKALPLLKRMVKGNKYLVLGNHDTKSDVKIYREYFQKVYGCLYFHPYRAICGHIPVHTYQLEGPYSRFDYCIHGHTHDWHVPLGNCIRDNRYLNVSVEVLGYKPRTFEELTQENFYDDISRH